MLIINNLGIKAAHDYMEKKAFVGALMAGARAVGGRALGALGMGAGKGLTSNALGAATALGTASDAKNMWHEARAALPPGG